MTGMIGINTLSAGTLRVVQLTQLVIPVLSGGAKRVWSDATCGQDIERDVFIQSF